ncbi:MAG TPA: hypothetical protein VIU85_05005 [Chthoniobacterales bacterium]
MFLLAAAFFVYAIAMAASQRTAAMWVTGVRYTAAVIPFVAAAAGCLIAKVSRGRIFLWLPLVVAFSFTNFAQVGPWLVWADKSPDPEGKIVAAHVPNKTIDRFIPTAQFLFVRDLWCPNVGTIGKSCEFLLANARSDEVLITNYEAEPLYFYTHLAQAMKIMRQDTIYDAARRQNLPDYVFSVDHVRWIVWRFNWNDYLGIRWSDVLRDLSEYGALATDVAEIKETAWENRENIHFHRFSGDTYLFPQDANRLPAHIFRIDWPNNS